MEAKSQTSPEREYTEPIASAKDLGTRHRQESLSTTLNSEDQPLGSTDIGSASSQLQGNQIGSDVEKCQTSQKKYSVFTVNQKKVIILVGSLVGFLSPLSGSIYYPALATIATALNVTESKINLSVTVYLVLQGIAPTFVAGFADSMGRRPAYIMCLLVYMAADLGLGIQNSYSALLGLRCLQSAGSSGTIALSNGIVGDLVTSAERGQYVAFASIGSILGPSLSPIIGGLIAQYLDWHWLFWFLLIVGSTLFVPVLLFLPETCRKVVGDGSILPPKLNWTLLDFLRHTKAKRTGTAVEDINKLPRNKFKPLSLISAVFILFDPESIIVLLATGMALANFYALSTGTTAAFKETRNFTDVQIALLFLPIGIGGLISAFTTGKLIDMNYRRHAKKLGIKVDKSVKQDLTDFPVEKARLEIALPLYLLAVVGIVGYGWTLDSKVNVAVPVVLLLILGYALIASFQAYNVLMVDLWPGQAASAVAANNLVRCELGAAASAAIDPMTRAMGRGWAFTLLALLCLTAMPGFLYLMSHGIELRKKKAERQKRKAQRKKENQVR